MVRQQVFLASLANHVLSAGTLTNPNRISELINATQQALVLDHAERIDSIDVNPLLVTGNGCVAVDALIVLQKEAPG